MPRELPQRPPLPAKCEGGWPEYRRRMSNWSRELTGRPYDWSRDGDR